MTTELYPIRRGLHGLFLFAIFTTALMYKEEKAMNNARKKVLEELTQNVNGMQELQIGSEEYLNATKAANQLAESQQKLKAVDWMQVANLGCSTLLVIVTIAASENHILDTRPVQFVKGLFKR